MEYVGQVWIILFIILFVVGISCTIAGLIVNVFKIFFAGLICVLLMLPAGIFAKAYTHEVETGRYEYQVLLDETVDINELASRYDIIGQDGLIWTIQDKEPIE
jgi:hypothetical protein